MIEAQQSSHPFPPNDGAGSGEGHGSPGCGTPRRGSKRLRTPRAWKDRRCAGWARPRSRGEQVVVAANFDLRFGSVASTSLSEALCVKPAAVNGTALLFTILAGSRQLTIWLPCPAQSPVKDLASRTVRAHRIDLGDSCPGLWRSQFRGASARAAQTKSRAHRAALRHQGETLAWAERGLKRAVQSPVVWVKLAERHKLEGTWLPEGRCT